MTRPHSRVRLVTDEEYLSARMPPVQVVDTRQRLVTPMDEDPAFWPIVIGLFAAIGLAALVYGAVVAIGMVLR
jgi:hypothetical protein